MRDYDQILYHMISPRIYPHCPRLYLILNLIRYSLGLWGILWELSEYALGYSSQTIPDYTQGIVQTIPGYIVQSRGLIWAVTPASVINYMSQTNP